MARKNLEQPSPEDDSENVKQEVPQPTTEKMPDWVVDNLKADAEAAQLKEAGKNNEIADQRVKLEEHFTTEEPFGETWRKEKARSFGLGENATVEEINQAEVRANNEEIDDQRTVKGQSIFDRLKHWINGD